MKKPQNPIERRKLLAFFAISITLAIVSAHGESRAPKPTEGEIALELFGLIAEQCDCAVYSVAWFESANQLVRYRCVEKLPEANSFMVKLGTKTKFLIEVSSAKAEYEQHFGNTGLRRPISLLAHLLVNFRENGNHSNASAPVLVYRPIVEIERSGEKNEFGPEIRDQ